MRGFLQALRQRTDSRPPTPPTSARRPAEPWFFGAAPWREVERNVLNHGSRGGVASVKVEAIRAWGRWVAYAGALTAVMALFAYGDLEESSFVANVVAEGHWSLYNYFQSVPALRSVPTAMPPLYYATTAAYLWLLHLLHLDPVPATVALMYRRQVLGHSRGWPVSLGLILLKLPNAAALALGAWGFRRLAAKRDWPRERLMWLWLACPILLVESFMQGQFDIIPPVITAGRV